MGTKEGAAGLAHHQDLVFGATIIRPSILSLVGRSGTIDVEPRVMQVLVALADMPGTVVTRAQLERQCWGGQIVGEDALNRSLFQLRRAAHAVSADFKIETIPRVGYRLTELLQCVEPAEEPPPAMSQRPSRRLLLGGAAGGLAMGAGALIFRSLPSARTMRARELVDRGDILSRDDVPDADEQGVKFYRAALELSPRDAAIWGKLALALGAMAEYASADATTKAVSDAEQAARFALALEPGQPDARVALIALPSHFGGWLPFEQALRGVLADAPENLAARANLSMFLMEVGRVSEGGAMGDRLVDREPLSPAFQYRHVYQLWARNRLREADLVADRALQLWPRHVALWLSRFWTFALSGRASAALAMIDSIAGRPELPAPLQNLLRVSGRALLPSRTPSDIEAAVDAHLAAAHNGQFGAVSAILILPQLGATDVAYDILRGYLLREGPLIGSLQRPAGQRAINQQTRRHTAPLWMPSAAPLRAHPQFMELCDAIGLADYWRRSGHEPDFRKV